MNRARRPQPTAILDRYSRRFRDLIKAGISTTGVLLQRDASPADDEMRQSPVRLPPRSRSVRKLDLLNLMIFAVGSCVGSGRESRQPPPVFQDDGATSKSNIERTPRDASGQRCPASRCTPSAAIRATSATTESRAGRSTCLRRRQRGELRWSTAIWWRRAAISACWPARV